MLISTPDQVTPEWLTARLTEQGILGHGAVTQVAIIEQSSQNGMFGDTASLSISYSPDTVGSVPRYLFLKTSKAGLHPEALAFGEREVAFYKAMSGLSGALPIPRCYDGVYDRESGHSHILIDDLSSTHSQPVYPLPPSPLHCEMLVESLAHCHAHWWNSAALWRDLGHLCGTFEVAATQHRLEATLPGFFDFLGDALLPAQRRLYQDVLASSLLSRREARSAQLAGVTLNHGDAHARSFMFPRDAESGRVMLIDWHLWEIAVPTDDPAYFMAYWWGPGRRAALERPLLETYHRQLIEHGVEHYDWDDCWRDYRESVILMTLVPIGQFRRNGHPSVLWSGLENSTAAYNDLGCADLL